MSDPVDTLTHPDHCRPTPDPAGTLNDLARRGQLPPADHWLLSVINGEPNWTLAESCLTIPTNGPDLSLLLGLLIVHRQKQVPVAKQALLADIDRHLYAWLRQQQAGSSVGFAPGYLIGLHYLALSSRFSPRVEQLLTDVLESRSSYAHWPGADLTIETGETGWVLLLLNWLGSRKTSQRITTIVSSLDSRISAYIGYLRTHQIPVMGEDEFYSLFPAVVNGAEWQSADWQAWRQGDLPQLVVLYQAGDLLGQTSSLWAWADRLGGYLTQQRQVGKLLVAAPGLTDGMAGLGLLYRRLFLLTQKPAYLQEGYVWFNEAIRQGCQPNDGQDTSLRTGLLGLLLAQRHWQGRDAGLDLLFL